MTEIRRAARSDIPRIVALVRDVLREFDLQFGRGSETDAQLFELPDSYEREGGAFWVASADGAILGTCGLARVAAGTFELRKMYLDPSARGAGVAQRLFDEALAFARDAGARAIALDTTDDMKAAMRFYERNGFVRDDTCIRGARCSRGYRLAITATSAQEGTRGCES